MSTASRTVIWSLSAANFVVGMGAFLVIGILEPLAQDLGASRAATGNLMTTYALTYAVLSPLLVAATGRIGRRRVLAAGFSLYGLASLASALAPDITTLHLARALAAAGAGVITPVAAAVAATLVPADQRARTLALVFAGITVAQALGIPAGSWLAYTIGWRWAFGVVALLSLPALILLWRMIPPGLPFHAVALRDLRANLTSLPIMVSVLFTTTFLGAIFVLYTYFTPLLAQVQGLGRDGVSLMLLLFGIGAILGNLFGGILSDRFGPSRTLIGLCLAQLAVLPLFSILPLNTWVLGLIVLIWSVIGWSFGAAQQVRLIILDATQAPVLLSLNAAGVYIGTALGAFIGGLVLAGFGPGLLGLAAAAGVALSLAHLLWSDKLNRRTFPAP
ncbi:MFS transporter [Roseobacter sp. HKCCD9010]|uniref:MFS transporter n=1 Tax=unclassified Roseobacter TaxID=196798 RepID=UPI00149259A0|nr:MULTISPECIES: MFS transporter [unclassified Roseobacter]MBF9051305.1 MFS transporter [Rhodobacterales bacterium HKCCD4356]NNV13352.1 MFS transporter [Roseobacter sp. HKCCD7357]NNV17603.1 MFS transporter [Roseobacter sp. HKCCD8768]NNV27209.1 MFS transporter [Roseobacter sp. HKCCD8192]NNV31329.1 MFS transporter [Roseobacter sp. HKCCD9061]